MSKFTRALAATLGAVVVALGIFTLLSNTVLTGNSTIESLKASAVNSAIDASGIKGQLESSLRSKASSISAATGLPESTVNSMIDQLDISSWSVTTLPSDAQSTGSFSTTYQGTAATVTTYSDPSYVSVEMSGQNLTLAVPSSAQGYVGYLKYL